MGLDASVDVTVGDVVGRLAEPYSHEFKADAAREGLSMKDNVGVRIGTYGALHYLRDFYEMVYNDQEGAAPDLDKVHLINHSDCDGYYIHEDFVDPIWHPIDKSKPHHGGQLSIGSSTKLFKELEYLKPFIEWLPPEEMVDQNDPQAAAFYVARRVFDRMYLLARASVATFRPIVFH